MKAEELLIPRYKVIATWPECEFSRNEILIEFQEENNKEKSFAGETFNFHDHPAHWPHLFQELKWWEERKIQDLPPFVKILDEVFKVDKWEIYFGEARPSKKGIFDGNLATAWFFNKEKSQPIDMTDAEYEDCKNSLQKALARETK